MGAFGPRAVVVREDGHTPPAPYPVINNAYSLLDVVDLVFIDAPGAGFSADPFWAWTMTRMRSPSSSSSS